MTVKKVPFTRPYGWLLEAFAAVRGNPRLLLRAAATVLLLASLPTVIEIMAGGAVRDVVAVRVALQLLFLVTALVLLPPVMGGFYRIAHAVREGRPTAPGDILAVFNDGRTARRLMLNNMAFVAMIAVLVLGIAYFFGGEELLAWLRAVSALKPGTTDFPPAPDGLLSLMGVLLLLGLLMNTAKELASAHIALSGRDPLSAIGEAFHATVANFPALLAFFLPVMLVGFIAMVIFAALAGLLATVLTLVHPMLAALALVPLALAVGVLLYALMLLFFYFAWRDTLGNGETGSVPEAIHQIEI